MTTIIFPGQGSQFIGMAKDFYDNFKIARLIFEEIQDYTDIDLKKIIFENKDDLINITNFTQISIFAASVAIYKSYINETDFNIKDINIMLGHSLGEYTALACSDKLTIKDCSLILKKRGSLMHNSVELNTTGMAALIGVNSKTIQDIIDQNNLDLEIANDNSQIQVVISGNINAIDKSKHIFLENNVKKFVKLNVSAAFHSKFMLEAQLELQKDIDMLNFKSNNVKIISNYSARISNDSSKIKESLKNQMANKVRWTESIENLSSEGEKNILEIGPGKVLSGLIKRISNSFDIKSISNVSDID